MFPIFFFFYFFSVFRFTSFFQSIMVRVGGGWCLLETYLEGHVKYALLPCSPGISLSVQQVLSLVLLPLTLCQHLSFRRREHKALNTQLHVDEETSAYETSQAVRVRRPIVEVRLLLDLT